MDNLLDFKSMAKILLKKDINKKIVRLNGYEHDWSKLQGKFIRNENVLLSNFRQVKPFDNIPAFPGTKKLFVTSCDTEFIAQTVDSLYFPFIKNLYVCSHHHHEQYANHLYYFENHEKSLGWLDEYKKIIELVTMEQMSELLNNYEEEDLIFIE
jgi:hypothetical protein